MDRKALLYVTTVLVPFLGSQPLLAQDAPGAPPQSAATAEAAADEGEILVTARKRQESILNVPVIATVVQQETLEQLGTRDLKDIGKLVPGLAFGNGVGLSGVQLSIRGVGTTTADPAIEQTVPLNIDGVQMSQGLAFQSGMFDVAQVEVFKGPQALFFGKSAPGGVIAIRTADPTDEFEVMARAGYDFVAEEKRAELVLSGPLSSTLRARLAGLIYDSNGFFKNVAVPVPGTGAVAPEHDVGEGHGYIARGTVIWEPEPTVTARLKFTMTRDKTYYSGADQKHSCPDGTRQPVGFAFLSNDEDCEIDREYRIVAMDPAAYPGYGGTEGEPRLIAKQRYGTLEINGRPTPDITLTSLTGYYHVSGNNLSNGSNTTAAGASILVPNSYHRTDWTQEFRVNTDFAGPFNLTAGIYVQDSKFDFTTMVATNAIYNAYFRTQAPPLSFFAFGPRLSWYTIEVDVRTVAPFGQVRFNPIPELEIAAGARYTNDKRSQRDFNRVTGVPVFVPPNALQAAGCNLAIKGLCAELESKGWQPELTVAYKPTADLTIFGSLKKGNKPGSFNVGAGPNTNVNNAYADETVKGGEFGIKGRAFGRRLTFEVAAFHYSYRDLQVGVIEPAPGGVPATRTVNAGSAKTYGVDFSFNYRPPQIDNLSIWFNGEYNHGRFGTLNTVPCWGGQMISEGCNQQFNPGNQANPPSPGSVVVNGQWGFYISQNLNGSRLPRAPDWQLNFGFGYKWSLGNNLNLGITNNNAFYSKYVVFPGNRSDFFQKAFIKSDLSLTLSPDNERWEVAFIGKNLNNRITMGSCANANYENASVYGGVITGGTARGSAGIDEVGCRTDRGRELWLRLTFRP